MSTATVSPTQSESLRILRTRHFNRARRTIHAFSTDLIDLALGERVTGRITFELSQGVVTAARIEETTEIEPVP